MLKNPAYEGAIAGAAAPFINASAETTGNLEATLQEKTNFQSTSPRVFTGKGSMNSENQKKTQPEASEVAQIYKIGHAYTK